MGATVLGNRYEILRKIGDGGMAFVYQAKDKLLNRIVAVKVLRPEYVDDEEFLVKFKREAEAVASLSHPNIVNVYDVGEDGKVHYIVMEYVDGQNLKEIIQNEGRLEVYTALDITKQIAKALGEAHRNGIIHRDIKPHNILISKDARLVKVADFGIAKEAGNLTMTNFGTVMGSVHYISPEQANGKHPTSRVDLYSLGIVLYEMIVGKVPFTDENPVSILLKHVKDEISFEDTGDVVVPKSIRTLIYRLTRKDPDQRYQTAEELIQDIEYIEKNIDLNYIQDYDKFTDTGKNISDFNHRYPNPGQYNEYDDDEYYDDEYDDEYYDDDEYDDDEYYDDPYYDEDYYEEKNKKKNNKKQKKKNKKQESPKARRRLKIIAFILILILIGYGVVAAKLMGFGPFGNHVEQGDTVTAPNVINMTVEQAQNAAESKGLNIVVKSQENSSTVDEGSIISQTPSAGTSLKKGDSIEVVVSKGENGNPVPNVVGLTLSQAEKLLRDNGFTLGNVKYEYSSAKEGVVLNQSIIGGASSEGQSVSLVVSKGRESSNEVPSIVDDDNDSSNYNGNTNNNGTYNGNSSNNSGGYNNGSGHNSNGGTSGGNGSNSNTGTDSGTSTDSDGSTGNDSSAGGSTDSSISQ